MGTGLILAKVKWGAKGLGSPERCKIFIAVFELLKYHIFRSVMKGWPGQVTIIYRNMLNGYFLNVT